MRAADWVECSISGDNVQIGAELGRESAGRSAGISLDTKLEAIGGNALAASLAGTVGGTRSGGRVIAVLGPDGGGVFIFAATSVDEFLDGVSATADAIARGVEYSRWGCGSDNVCRRLNSPLGPLESNEGGCHGFRQIAGRAQENHEWDLSILRCRDAGSDVGNEARHS